MYCKISMCLATYVRWQRGTARIRPPQSIDIFYTPGPQQNTSDVYIVNYH